MHSLFFTAVSQQLNPLFLMKVQESYRGWMAAWLANDDNNDENEDDKLKVHLKLKSKRLFLKIEVNNGESYVLA